MSKLQNGSFNSRVDFARFQRSRCGERKNGHGRCGGEQGGDRGQVPITEHFHVLRLLALCRRAVQR